VLSRQRTKSIPIVAEQYFSNRRVRVHVKPCYHIPGGYTLPGDSFGQTEDG
jgi:hypothetical protein